MKFTEKQQEEFKILTNQLIIWLNDNTNPHCKIIIDTNDAELISAELVNNTKGVFVND